MDVLENNNSLLDPLLPSNSSNNNNRDRESNNNSSSNMGENNAVTLKRQNGYQIVTAANVEAEQQQDANDDDEDEVCGDCRERDGLVAVTTTTDDAVVPLSPTANSDGDMPRATFWKWLFLKPLLPDHRFSVGGIKFLDGEFAVKLLKFTAFTYLGIAFIFWFVRLINWEHDEEIQLQDIWTYESTLIATDIVFFFVVGRLWKQRGVDHLAWLAFALAANLYSSYITDFRMFQHSFTLFEMHCRWPWQLWAFLLAMIPLIAIIAILHLKQAIRERVVVQKTVEMLLCVLFTMGPYIGNPYFHLHHWFAGWLVGMHFNFDVWWSRAAMAWCWGCYINGIAVYGRDPVLTCGYALFISKDQRCPFVQCYLDGLRPSGVDNETQPPMVPPDWRHCTHA